MPLLASLLKLLHPGRKVLSPREGYDLWAPSYQFETNPVKVFSNETVVQMMPDLGGKDVLDLGCGCGYFCQIAEQGRSRSVTGVDLSPNMLEVAKNHAENRLTRFVLARAEELPFENESFDIIINALVAGHIQKLDSLVGEISRVLKSHGTCIVSDFHPANTLQGARRTFARDGRIYEISHYLHTLDEYVHHLTMHRLIIKEISEPRWHGTPLIFVIKARKLSLK